jgi:hypothetical protein
VVVLHGNPSKFIVVFQGRRLPGHKFREPNTHHGPFIEDPPIRTTRLQLRPEPNLNAELFCEFPVEGGLCSFAGFYFSSGKFPHPCKLRRCRAARGKKARRCFQGVDDRGSNNVYQCSHFPSLGAAA